MTKHRLELFSDGVFAIVLTLLVLDLHPPHALGLAGLREMAPALLVHAATFAVVGVLWVSHHNILAVVEKITVSTLLLNLLALFWLTLMPFMAKVAAEHPLDSLGASGLALCYGLFSATTVAARATMSSVYENVTGNRRFTTVRLWQYGSVAALRLVLAGLAWVSPWFGYAALPTFAVVFLFPSRSPEEMAAMVAAAKEPVAE
jgi:uncharacterized membrane protein